MNASSIPVSSQSGAHPRLAEVVGRHLRTVWRRPFRAYSQAAFERAAAALQPDRPVILDSGCGSGWSTARLAADAGDCEVLGIDRSALRLKRHPPLPSNGYLMRADLADFWRLARQAGWRLRRHYLLYPNPWPKPDHLKRRWHAHPVWPDLLALGGALELRTNFEIYADEFALALQMAGFAAEVEVLSLAAERALSAFELKYIRSGHPLFRVRVCLSVIG